MELVGDTEKEVVVKVTIAKKVWLMTNVYLLEQFVDHGSDGWPKKRMEVGS